MSEDIPDETQDKSALDLGISEALKKELETLEKGSTIPSIRPLSRPAPSARVRALGKEDLIDEPSAADDDEDDDDDDDDDEDPAIQVEGAYEPTDYEHLSVTPEIKELFQYITRYTPQTIELDHKLKPFIPEFIPAVGDIDAFLKVPRPDKEEDLLGLAILDEPCARQSDPTVLNLQLRAISKEASSASHAMVVKSLENADKNPKEIESWVNNITTLHRAKPPPTVHYTRAMPDIENLMQEWPIEFENLLKEIGHLPSSDLDCSLDEYVQIICSLLDIPIYKSKVQALHVLFTLYCEFKNSQHFRNLGISNPLENAGDKLDPFQNRGRSS